MFETTRKLKTIFRKVSGSSIPVELDFGDAGFCERRKTGETCEEPSEQCENQQQSQRTYVTGAASNPGHIGESRAHYHCAMLPRYFL